MTTPAESGKVGLHSATSQISGVIVKKHIKTLILLFIICLVALVFSGCTTQKENRLPVDIFQPTSITIPYSQGWNSATLQVYGTATPDTITVYILGQVLCPGLHHIPKNTTAFHAIMSANGLTKSGTWRPPYSGIIRSYSWRMPILIDIDEEPRHSGGLVSLENGDQLFIGEHIE